MEVRTGYPGELPISFTEQGKLISMSYREYTFQLNPGGEELRGVLISLLAMEGFEGFTEEENSVTAYISPDDAAVFAPEHIIHLMGNMGAGVSFTVDTVEEKNWNDLWERNYDPVYLDKDVQIRAPFHEELQGFTYTILIEPKMSFGTGHHHTTRMMMRMLLGLDLEGKTLLDMGCGTGVLAILAALRGAGEVTAIDIDPWAYENTIENCELNLDRDIEILIGDAKLLEGRHFDIILANINRNILLEDMPAYAAALEKGGKLVISGIMPADSGQIEERAAAFGLKAVKRLSEGEWTAILFE